MRENPSERKNRRERQEVLMEFLDQNPSFENLVDWFSENQNHRLLFSGESDTSLKTSALRIAFESRLLETLKSIPKEGREEKLKYFQKTADLSSMRKLKKMAQKEKKGALSGKISFRDKIWVNLFVGLEKFDHLQATQEEIFEKTSEFISNNGRED